MTHAVYLPRSAWNAAPAKAGPGPLTPSRVRGVVVHWPGSGEDDSFDGRAEVAAALRGWQRFHQEERGWSDIAYQVAVDQAGRAWNLRGLRTQSGANGDDDLNEEYGAILLVLVAGEEPTAEMKATVRNVVLDFRDLYGDDAAEIRPHSAVRPEGTDCPGPLARAAIARGDFEPWADHPEEDPLSGITADAIGAAVAKALTPKLDALATKLEAIEQKYVVADNAADAQVAVWEAVGQAYAAHLLAGGAGIPTAKLTEVRDQVWSFMRPVWTKP